MSNTLSTNSQKCYMSIQLHSETQVSDHLGMSGV